MNVNKRIALGCGMLALIFAFCFLTPSLLGFGEGQVNSRAIMKPPLTQGHLLGTDSLGRDMLTLIARGGQVSLIVGFVAAVVAAVIGVTIGVASALGPRWIDKLLTGLSNTALAIPFLVILVGLREFFEPSTLSVATIVGALSWMGVASVTRAQVRSISALGYVRAARSSGASEWRILFRHILPNAMPPVLAMASFVVAGAIMTEATLSFLSLGVPRSTPSWGTVLSGVHRELLLGNWWVLAGPAFAITFTVIAVKTIADALRERRL